MKRLIKNAIISQDVFENTINQLSEKGRNILKLLEEYKFSLEQSSRIFANDQQLTQKLTQKMKTMDAAAGQVYSAVFDIENIDIVTAYENQVTQSMPSAPPVGSSSPTPSPQHLQTPSNDDNDEEESDDSIPSGGGGGSDDAETPSSDSEDGEESTEDAEENSEEDSGVPQL